MTPSLSNGPTLSLITGLPDLIDEPQGLREGKSAREVAMEKPNAIAPRAR
jgi:hypothetical protein